MKINISQAIIIALLPFYGYIAAYYYEVGYLASFNLPPMLIQIRPESLLNFVQATFFPFLLTYALLVVLWPIYKIRHKYPLLKALIQVLFMPLSITIVILYIDISSLKQYYQILIFFFLMNTVLYIGIPLLQFRKEKISLIEKIRKSDEAEANSNSSWGHSFNKDILFSSQRALSIFLLAFLAFIVYIVGEMIGLRNGRMETQFLTFTRDNEKYALVKDYDNEKIAVKIKNSRFTSEYILLDNINELKLTREIILHNP